MPTTTTATTKTYTPERLTKKTSLARDVPSNIYKTRYICTNSVFRCSSCPAVEHPKTEICANRRESISSYPKTISASGGCDAGVGVLVAIWWLLICGGGRFVVVIVLGEGNLIIIFHDSFFAELWRRIKGGLAATSLPRWELCPGSARVGLFFENAFILVWIIAFFLW